MADTGWFDFSEFYTLSDGVANWDSPGQARLGDALATTAILKDQASHTLVARGCDVPSAAKGRLTGIAIRLLRSRVHPPISNFEIYVPGQAYDTSLKIMIGGESIGDNKASNTNWPTVAAEQVYGADGDLWGISVDGGFEISDILSREAQFGVALRCYGTTSIYKLGPGASFDIYLDAWTFAAVNHIQAKLFYDPRAMFLGL